MNNPNFPVYHIDFSFDSFKLGGSAFAQSLNKIGSNVPTVTDADYFAKTFNTIQDLINKGLIVAGHDISAGGMLTALLEMCFANNEGGLQVDLNTLAEEDIIKVLFAENPSVLVQTSDAESLEKILSDNEISFTRIAQPIEERHIFITKDEIDYHFGITYFTDILFKSSYLLYKK